MITRQILEKTIKWASKSSRYDQSYYRTEYPHGVVSEAMVRLGLPADSWPVGDQIADDPWVRTIVGILCGIHADVLLLVPYVRDDGILDCRGLNLRGANLRRANLRGANLRDARLQGADLRDADLRDADLQGVDLRDAYLRRTRLRDADLRGARLKGAYLRHADLLGADLRDADLRGADLRDALLEGARLERADLRDAFCGKTLGIPNLDHDDEARTRFIDYLKNPAMDVGQLALQYLDNDEPDARAAIVLAGWVAVGLENARAFRRAGNIQEALKCEEAADKYYYRIAERYRW